MVAAVRASGAGLRVFFGQFIKDDAYSEIGVLKSLPGIRLEQFGTGSGILLGRAETADDLYRRADAALYDGKSAGRNRVEIG